MTVSKCFMRVGLKINLLQENKSTMLTAKSKLRNLKSKPGFFEQDESETCNFPFSDDLTIDTAIDRKNPRAYERDPKIRVSKNK